jgi:hypothetical protein
MIVYNIQKSLLKYFKSLVSVIVYSSEHVPRFVSHVVPYVNLYTFHSVSVHLKIKVILRQIGFLREL